MCLLATLQAQPAAPNLELAKTLALPISPGSIALLSEFPTERAAQQRVKEALADSHPEVRTVAGSGRGQRGTARLDDAGSEVRHLYRLRRCRRAARLSGDGDGGRARLNSPELLDYIPLL